MINVFISNNKIAHDIENRKKGIAAASAWEKSEYIEQENKKLK